MLQVFMPPTPLPSYADLLIVAFSSIAIYNALEIYIWIWHMFKKQKGLYYWSMHTAVMGILVHTVFQVTSTYNKVPPMPSSLFTILGYYMMSVSPLFVLYSRLHIMSLNFRRIRWIFFFIVGISCVLIVPSLIITVCAVCNVPGFLKALHVYLGLQIACFTLTELALSSFFIWTAYHTLQPILAVKGKQGRKFITSIFVIYLFVVVLLISLLVFLIFEYLRYYFISITLNPFVCSVKLKFEFTIITLLQEFMHLSPTGAGGWSDVMPLENSHNSFSSYGNMSTMKQRSPSDSSGHREYVPDLESQHAAGLGYKRASDANGFDQYAIEEEQIYQQAALQGSVVQLPSPSKVRPWEQMYLGPERI